MAGKKNTTGKFKASIDVFCVDCGLYGKLKMHGSAKFDLLALSLSDGKIDLKGSLHAGVGLGIDAKASYTKRFKKNLATAGVEGLMIPGIIIVGPVIKLAAELDLTLAGEAQVMAGIYYKVDNFTATISLSDSQKSVAPNFTAHWDKVFFAKGQVTATALFALPITFGFGLDLPIIKKSKTISITDKPGIKFQAKALLTTDGSGLKSTKVDKCANGLAWGIYVVNSITLDFFGLAQSKLSDWQSQLDGDCYHFPGLPTFTATSSSLSTSSKAVSTSTITTRTSSTIPATLTSSVLPTSSTVSSLRFLPSSSSSSVMVSATAISISNAPSSATAPSSSIAPASATAPSSSLTLTSAPTVTTSIGIQASCAIYKTSIPIQSGCALAYQPSHAQYSEVDSNPAIGRAQCQTKCDLNPLCNNYWYAVQKTGPTSGRGECIADTQPLNRQVFLNPYCGRPDFPYELGMQRVNTNCPATPDCNTSGYTALELRDAGCTYDAFSSSGVRAFNAQASTLTEQDATDRCRAACDGGYNCQFWFLSMQAYIIGSTDVSIATTGQWTCWIDTAPYDVSKKKCSPLAAHPAMYSVFYPVYVAYQSNRNTCIAKLGTVVKRDVLDPAASSPSDAKSSSSADGSSPTANPTDTAPAADASALFSADDLGLDDVPADLSAFAAMSDFSDAPDVSDADLTADAGDGSLPLEPADDTPFTDAEFADEYTPSNLDLSLTFLPIPDNATIPDSTGNSTTDSNHASSNSSTPLDSTSDDGPSTYYILTDPSGLYILSPSASNNLVLTDSSLYTANPSLTPRFTGDSAGNIIADISQNLLHYHPSSLTAFGASRLRTSDPAHIPKSAHLLALVPVATDASAEDAAAGTASSVLLAVDLLTDQAFALAWCEYADASGVEGHLFLVDDPDVGLGALVGDGLQRVVTGGVVERCVAVGLVANVV